MHQTPTACATCPWLTTSDPKFYFKPEALQRTTVEYLQREQLHPCHSRSSTFCPGYLSFVHHRQGGIDRLALGRMAIYLKLLSPDLIPQLDTFETIEAMLQEHGERHQNAELWNSIFEN